MRDPDPPPRKTTMPDTTTKPERPLRPHIIEITPKVGGETTTRYVNAKTELGAVAHISDRTIKCRRATATEAYELGRRGVEFETAGESAEPAKHDPAGGVPGEP